MDSKCWFCWLPKMPGTMLEKSKQKDTILDHVLHLPIWQLSVPVVCIGENNLCQMHILTLATTLVVNSDSQIQVCSVWVDRHNH